MLKRFARLTLVATVVLSSVLNAEKSVPVNAVSDDSFSCQISKIHETTVWTLLPINPEQFENFSKSSIEILAEQDGTNFDDLLVKTIKKLATEIDPEKAGNMYLACVKNIFDKAIATVNFESLFSSKNEDEFKQTLGSLFQNMLNEMTSKDALLEQAIYFSTFSDEIVKDITKTMSEIMQEFCTKMGNFEYTSDRQKLATEFKKMFDEFLTNDLNLTATVFENHGYKIDRQGLGL